MSDTQYPVFQHYGTNAERLAFTPSPPAGFQPIYIWKNTDAGLGTYVYDTGWSQIAGATAGHMVQVVNTQTGASTTGTTQIPGDDTIPTITEGDQYMTLAITPTSATNKLRIDVIVYLGHSAIRYLAVALFQDATSAALAVQGAYNPAAGSTVNIALSHYMTAGTTSATTFRVRAGADGAGTLTFNGQGGGRLYGGVLASSITITEILV